MNTIEVVKSIVSHKTPVEDLTEDSLLLSLGLNSLDLVEITLEIEDAFHINFTSGEILNLKTIKDLVTLIDRKRQ